MLGTDTTEKATPILTQKTLQDPSLVKIHSGITVEPEELKVNNSNSSIEADSIQETKHPSFKVSSTQKELTEEE